MGSAWRASRARKAALRARARRREIQPGDLPGLGRVTLAFGFFGGGAVLALTCAYLGIRDGQACWALFGFAIGVFCLWVVIKLSFAYFDMKRALKARHDDA
jgi:hypothetical protein